MSEEQQESGDHLVELHDGWCLWQWFALRAAGVSAAMLEPLAAPAAVAAADAMVSAENALADARARAIEALEQHVQDRSGDPHVAALRKLRAGQALVSSGLAAEAASALDAFARAEANHSEHERVGAAILVDERHRIGRVLRVAGADARIREAVLWQNRAVYQTGFAWLLRQPPEATNSKTRQAEAAIAKYLQRYCVKNDTIGFFGPIGWGTFVKEDSQAAAMAGDALLSRRTVYFEHWAIDALAAAFSSDTELLPYVTPRRMPSVRIDGRVLHHGSQRIELPHAFAVLLRACDGERTARDVVAVLASDPESLLDDEDEGLSMLAELRDRRLVCWSLEIPTATAFPERELRGLLAHAPAPVREPMLNKLETLEAARDRVVAAAGKPEALEGALSNLDETFIRITGHEATRRAGETYGGRTLIHEDCIRNFDLRLGPEVLKRLGPPLSLVLQSARWYTYTLAERYRRAFREIFKELGNQRVDYLQFCERAAPLFALDSAFVGEVVSELEHRWASILGVADGSRSTRIEISSAAIRAAVADVFAAPHPGWPLARYQSPDIMIAAASAEHVLQGNARFVLGEIHTGRSLFTARYLLRERPDLESLRRACRYDVRAPRVTPVSPKESDTRLDFGPAINCDYEIELGVTRSHLPRDRVLAAADLVVVDTPADLMVETRDHRVQLDIITCFERHVLFASLARFSLLRKSAHDPRISIDDLVISRECWQFSPAELPFATATPGLSQFSGARRWATANGIPRRVFVRVPQERKPMYVDLSSPTYVEIFSKLVRSASRVAVSEMLPLPDELWLADHEDHRYTSELRITAVDPIPWRPPERHDP